MKTAYIPDNLTVDQAATADAPFAITDTLIFTGMDGRKQLELMSSVYEVWRHLREGAFCELETVGGVSLARVALGEFTLHHCLSVAFQVFDKVVTTYQRAAAQEALDLVQRNLEQMAPAGAPGPQSDR